jgi:hypothetical protein
MQRSPVAAAPASLAAAAAAAAALVLRQTAAAHPAPCLHTRMHQKQTHVSKAPKPCQHMQHCILSTLHNAWKRVQLV